MSTVVQHKPLQLADVRDLVRPEDFQQIQQLEQQHGDEPLQLMRRVWRDAIVDTLASKATATKMAVAALVRARLGVDAYAIARHLFENVVVLLWLMRPKDEAARNERLDTYAAHLEAFKVRLDEVERNFAAQFGEDLPENHIADDRCREISADVFQDRWVSWAWFKSPTNKRVLIRLSDMAREVGAQSLYETQYFEMCAFVHSAPASIFEHSTAPAESSARRGTFAIDAALFRDDYWAGQAITMSNAYFIMLLTELDVLYNFGLQKPIEELASEILVAVEKKPHLFGDEGTENYGA